MRELAPIVLFTYNRPIHVKRTIEALQKNKLAKESDLYIYSDGWKNEVDKSLVDEVRRYLHSVSGFKNVYVLENDVNKKLAPSLITGISKMFETFDKIIVFEDDIVCSEWTLDFFNDALEIYKEDLNVGMIHGHIEYVEHLPELFFDSRSGCWAWATWQRAWSKVSFDGEALLSEIVKQKRQKEFDMNGTYRYIRMLKNQIAGKNSSWAVRVYASFFLQGMLTLYPGKSYAAHIGFDGGTHCNNETVAGPFDGVIAAKKNVAKRIPIEVDLEARKKIEDLNRTIKKISLAFVINEMRKKVRKYLKKLQY